MKKQKIECLKNTDFNYLFPHVFLNNKTVILGYIYDIKYLTVSFSSSTLARVPSLFIKQIEIEFNLSSFTSKYKQLYLEDPTKFQRWFYDYLDSFIIKDDMDLIFFK